MGFKGNSLYKVVIAFIFISPFFIGASNELKKTSIVNQDLELNILERAMMKNELDQDQLKEDLNHILGDYTKAYTVISLLNKFNAKDTAELTLLEKEMEQVKQNREEAIKQYQSILLAEYKQKDYENKLYYLASAENLKEFFVRSKQLKKLKKLRKQQLESIEKQKRIVDDKILIYNGSQENRDSLMNKKLEDFEHCIGQLKSTKSTLYNLQMEHVDLSLVLKNRKRLLGGLQKTKSEVHVNELSMKWPVRSGILIRAFGKANHHIEHGVLVPRNGINIVTNHSENVLPISLGIVKAVTNIPDYGSTLIVQHQEFMAVYSHLDQIKVAVNDFVYLDTKLGTVSQNNEGQHLLHFELWQNNKPVDPEHHLIGILE
jgi:murein DD-endopeptidase MepM/ murein hydrolase activator NlpD